MGPFGGKVEKDNVLRDHNGSVYQIIVVNDYLCSASGDGTIKVNI
jgi:hypothetical protein